MSLVCSEFSARKEQSINELLAGVTDRSPKGSVDEPIWPLINLINQSVNYYTTSSCSGRISAFQHTSHQSIKQGKWIVCEHGKVTYQQFMDAWNQSTSRSNIQSTLQSNGTSVDHPITQSLDQAIDQTEVGTVLKFEPFIVSVACRSLQAATDLLTIAIGAGCRESGIMAVPVDDQPIIQSTNQSSNQTINLSRPIMVSIRCSIRLEAPLSKAGKLIVNDDYLHELIDQSNHKFDLNQKRIDRFTESLRKWLEQHEPSNDPSNNQPNKKWWETADSANKSVSCNQTNSQSNDQQAETEAMRKLREKQTRLIDQIHQLDRRIESISHVIKQSAATDADGSNDQDSVPLTNLDDQSNRSWCLLVPRQCVNIIRNACKQNDFNQLDQKPSSIKQSIIDQMFNRSTSQPNEQSKDDWMAMPINQRALQAIHQSISQSTNHKSDQQSCLLSALGLAHDALPHQSIYLHFYAHPVAQAKPAIDQSIKQSPQRLLQHKLEQFIKQHSVDFPIDRLTDCSFKWEQFGDLVILSHHSFNQQINQQLINACSTHQPSLLPDLYQTICSSLKCARLAIQHPIESTLHRRSAVQLLVGEHARVRHRENGVIFEFDAAKTMFSSGNGTEKQRLVKLINENPHGEDLLVDLYAGIGFWVCPVLVHTAVKHVIAFEHNPDTFAALEASLVANRIDKQRYETNCMDNRTPAVKEKISNRADRVLLGLLPSSEEAWSTALIALKPAGGVLHVHANVHESEHQSFAQGMAQRLKVLLNEIVKQSPEQSVKSDWTIDVDHVEWVKSFAPRVDHVVVDIRCKPTQSSNQTSTPIGSQMSTLAASSDKQLTHQPISRSLTSHVYRRDGTLSYDNPSFDEFWRVIYPASKPALLQGLDIGAIDQFSIDQLSSVDCSIDCSIHVCPEVNGRMDFVNKNYIHRVMPFKQFIQRVMSQVNQPSTNAQSTNHSIEQSQQYFITPSEKYYLRSLGADPRAEVANFNHSFPMLAKHFKAPRILEERFSNGQSSKQANKSRLFSSVFRVSSRGLSLWTHYDAVDNILCHLYGVKRVVLFPPSSCGDLYLNTAPHTSSSPVIDIDSLNQPRWPRFSNAQRAGIEVILQPGDCLFIPALWFHHIDAVTECVSVNLFWRELPDSLYQPKDLYGNADVKPGVRAIELGKDIGDVLAKLPTHYQEFYTMRALEAAREGKW